MEEQTLFSVGDPELIPLPGQLSFFPDSQAPARPAAKPRHFPELKPMRLQDPDLVRILLCTVLWKLEKPVPEAWLYDIVVGSGYINYFLYTDALGFLVENRSVIQTETENGSCYALTEIGVACAKGMRRYIAKTMRDRVVLTALRYAARKKAMEEMSIAYETVSDGCILCVQCRDGAREMFSLRIHTPGRHAADELLERIMRNPAAFFGKILDAAMHNEEESFDLSDN